MTKRLLFFLSFLLSFSLSATRTTLMLPVGITLPLSQKPLFLFDVGTVLLKQDQFNNIPRYCKIISQSPGHRWELTQVLPWCLIRMSTLKKLQRTGPEDGIIDYITQHHPVLNKQTTKGIKISDAIKEILCAASPIIANQKLLANLISQGHEVALATNKGRATIDRFINSGALIAAHYRFIFTCDSHSNPAHHIFYKKPSQIYFEKLWEVIRNADLATVPIIFIDNEIKNVQAAVASGMIGIHYISPKQLANDLKLLGIAIN